MQNIMYYFCIDLLPGVRINSVVLPLMRIDLPHSTCLRTSTSQWGGKFHNGLWLEKRPLFSAMCKGGPLAVTWPLSQKCPINAHKLQIIERIEGFFLMCCGKLLEMRLLKMLVLAHIFRHVHVVLLTRAGFDLGSCFFPGCAGWDKSLWPWICTTFCALTRRMAIWQSFLGRKMPMDAYG